jgi:hypothetical protein
VLTLIVIAVVCFVAGLAVQRHQRDDTICNAFSDTVIALVMTPINSFKARLAAAPPTEPDKPARRLKNDAANP